ncbi:HGxxPAAW family protein [Streptomyces griseoluteus]|uniref:HGxxPAAW family protein n=1 Tax=Streptomyces griseoluteus TaxID=29306 RepID=UPI0037F510DE
MSLYDEGHTIAGWTGCAIATVGSGVVGAGVCTGSVAALVGGTVLVAVSVVVTWVLHLSGWGKPPGVRPREEWRMRTRDTQARGGHAGCVGCALAGRRPASTPAVTRAEPIPLSPIE